MNLICQCENLQSEIWCPALSFCYQVFGKEIGCRPGRVALGLEPPRDLPKRRLEKE